MCGGGQGLHHNPTPLGHRGQGSEVHLGAGTARHAVTNPVGLRRVAWGGGGVEDVLLGVEKGRGKQFVASR